MTHCPCFRSSLSCKANFSAFNTLRCVSCHMLWMQGGESKALNAGDSSLDHSATREGKYKAWAAKRVCISTFFCRVPFAYIWFGNRVALILIVTQNKCLKSAWSRTSKITFMLLIPLGFAMARYPHQNSQFCSSAFHYQAQPLIHLLPI